MTRRQILLGMPAFLRNRPQRVIGLMVDGSVVVVENVFARLSHAEHVHQAEGAAAKLQVVLSAVQEVDMATTLSNLTATQTQLQASYRLISAANSLSLVSFLPASA